MSLYPEESTYLQLDRDVKHGVDELLLVAQDIGREILGVTMTTSRNIDIIRETETGLHETTVMVPLEKPLMTVREANEIRVILQHHRIPSSQYSQLKPVWQAHQLTVPKKPVYKSPEIEADTKKVPAINELYDNSRKRRMTLREQLDLVSKDNGVDPNRLVVEYDSVAKIDEVGSPSVLALFPTAGTIGNFVLDQQINIYNNRLKQQNRRYERLPGTTTPKGIRFADVPCDIKPGEGSAILQEIEKCLPVRVVLARPKSRVVSSK